MTTCTCTDPKTHRLQIYAKLRIAHIMLFFPVHFLFILHFRVPLFLFLLFVCNYLLFTFYSTVSEIVYMMNCFIHELKLENDSGTVETLFLFLIACFCNKMIWTSCVKVIICAILFPKTNSVVRFNETVKSGNQWPCHFVPVCKELTWFSS